MWSWRKVLWRNKRLSRSSYVLLTLRNSSSILYSKYDAGTEVDIPLQVIDTTPFTANLAIYPSNEIPRSTSKLLQYITIVKRVINGIIQWLDMGPEYPSDYTGDGPDSSEESDPENRSEFAAR